MKRLITAIVVLLSILVPSLAYSLEWAGSEPTIGFNYRIPVYTSWGLQASGELRAIPSSDKVYQSLSLGGGWYCGNRWYYITIGGIRNWFAEGNEAMTWGLVAGTSTSNGNIWAEADAHFIESKGFPHQYYGRYRFVRLFHPLMLTANVEQRNLNEIRIGPGIGIYSRDGFSLIGKWLVWRDLDTVKTPPMHSVRIEVMWYFPLPGEDAKRQAGYSTYLGQPPLPPK